MVDEAMVTEIEARAEEELRAVREKRGAVTVKEEEEKRLWEREVALRALQRALSRLRAAA